MPAPAPETQTKQRVRRPKPLTPDQILILESVTKVRRDFDDAVANFKKLLKESVILAWSADIPIRAIAAASGTSNRRVHDLAPGMRRANSVHQAGEFRSGVRSTEQQRQQIVLHVRNGISQRKIAGLMGCSLHTVSRVWQEESQRWGIKGPAAYEQRHRKSNQRLQKEQKAER